jgi:N-acetylated-alpha-linked acidic dipeptidase
VYVATLQRVLNNPLHPFDFRLLGVEFQETLTSYADAAGADANFQPAFDALSELQVALEALYSKSSQLINRPVTDSAVRAYNDAILELGRELIQINFTRQGAFRTEPAVKIPPLPDLAPAKQLAESSGHMRNVIRTHLLRGVNRVAWSFENATKIAQRAVAKIEG